MESYGALLKKAREEKKIDIATVERDTTISREYIEALESEDTAVFPGEPYLYGFLHNYAEYLGLDADSIAVLYKKKKIQESPVPQALYEKHTSPLLIPVIVAGFLLLAGGVTALIFAHSRRVKNAENSVALSKNSNVHQYTLTDAPFQQRLYKGDQVIVPEKSGKVILTVAGTLGSLTLDTPAGRQFIDLSEELELDIDGNAIPELIVYVSDISSTDENRGVEVKMLVKKETPASPVIDISKIPSGEDVPKLQPQNIILTDGRAYPFTVNATFRGSCVFRSIVDNADSSEEYYKSGDVVSMTPQNRVRLWISNSNAVKLQVLANGQIYNLETVKSGLVVVEDIKWIKDSDGQYKVVAIEVD